MRNLLLIITASIFVATITAMSSSILPHFILAATTTTKSPDFFTYQNSTYGVKIRYPSSWGVQTGVNVLDEKGILVQPTNAITYFQLGVEEQLNPGETKNIDLYLRSIINAYRFNSTDFSIVSANTYATLAGRQAYSLVFSDTYEGFPTKTMIKGIFDGDRNYYLLFTAEAAKFSGFLPTVQKMINSFELSTPTPTSTLQSQTGKLDNTLIYLGTTR